MPYNITTYSIPFNKTMVLFAENWIICNLVICNCIYCHKCIWLCSPTNSNWLEQNPIFFIIWYSSFIPNQIACLILQVQNQGQKWYMKESWSTLRDIFLDIFYLMASFPFQQNQKMSRNQTKKSHTFSLFDVHVYLCVQTS